MALLYILNLKLMYYTSYLLKYSIFLARVTVPV